MAQRIKKDDTVLVISGRDKGKRGKVVRVDPDAGRLVVEGVNMITRHKRQRPGVAQAGRLQQEGLIYMAKVMLVDPETAKPGRVGWKFLDDGTKVRTVKNGKRA